MYKIYSGFGLTLLVASLSYGQAPAPTETPYDDTLKCVKEKVLHSRVFNDEKLDYRDGSTVNFGEKVKYLYVSNVSVPIAIYEGRTEKIRKRTKSMQVFPDGKDINGKRQWIAKVYVGEPFYHDEPTDTWYQTETAIMKKDTFNNQTKLSFWQRLWEVLFFKDAHAKTYFYSDAGDGVCEMADFWPCDWDTLHDFANGPPNDYSTSSPVGYWAEFLYFLNRGFFPVPTHGIPAGATISAAEFICKAGVYQGGTDYTLTLTTQADPRNLAAGDYDSFLTTVHNPDRIADDEFPVGGVLKTITWTLDDPDNDITKEGWTKLGVRESEYDVDDDDNCYGATTYLFFVFSDFEGSHFDPVLVVTYTGGGGARRSWTTTHGD